MDDENSFDATLSARFMAAIGKTMDKRIAPNAPSHTALVEKVEDEVTWVSIYGGNPKAPATRTMITVQPGELVTCHIENGSLVIDGNLTSSSVSTAYVEGFAQALAAAITGVPATSTDVAYPIDTVNSDAIYRSVMALSGHFQSLEATLAKIDKLEVRNLNAVKAYIQELITENITAANLRVTYAYINELTASKITTDKLEAASAYIDNLDAESITVEDLKAVKSYIQELTVDDLTAKKLRAAAAYITELEASYAEISDLTAEIAKITKLEAEKADIDLLNVETADIENLVARTAWFDKITTEDATVTGVLKAILLDGDTLRFRNIYANALKLLGPDGLYHALNFEGKDETKQTTFTKVEPSGFENPMSEGWYVLDGSSYSLSTDYTVDPDAEYYLMAEEYVDKNTKVFFDKYGESLDGGLHGSNLISQSVTADQIDVNTLIARMLLTQNVIVGNPQGFHVRITDSELSLNNGESSENVDNRVAYINHRQLYVPYSVVLSEMQLGQNKWGWRCEPSNNSMTLVWLGDEVGGE